MILPTLLLLVFAPYDACKDAQTQLELNLCSAAAANRADAEMAVALRQLLARFKGTDLEKAIDLAQAKWVDFREAECTAKAKFHEGGSITPMVRAQCWAYLAIDRKKQLEEFAPVH